MRDLALTLLATAAVLAADSAPILGQLRTQRPNFSGTWKQNNLLTTPAGVTDRTYTETIEHLTSTLKIHVNIKSTPGAAVYDRTYQIGGAPAKTSTADYERTTTATWEGSSLVVVMVQKDADSTTTVRETWSLSDDGAVLTRLRHTTGSEGTTQSTQVLEKQ